MTLTLVNPLFVKNSSRESFQIWSKRSFRLTEELIRFRWSKVKGQGHRTRSRPLEHDISSLSSGDFFTFWLKEKLIRFQWSKVKGYSELMLLWMQHVRNLEGRTLHWLVVAYKRRVGTLVWQERRINYIYCFFSWKEPSVILIQNTDSVIVSSHCASCLLRYI